MNQGHAALCKRLFAAGAVAASIFAISARGQAIPTSPRSTAAVQTASNTAAAPTAGTARVNPSYVIGPGDMLAISVWNEPEVTGKVPVRSDGMITVPLIGDVQASGLTPDRLQTAITQRLVEYVKQPSVTVVVEEMNSRDFNVLGEVQHPGSFPLNKPTRVLDAIAQAGGFGSFARSSKIYILRRDSSGGTVKLPFNYKRVSSGREDSENIELQPGDTVIVP